MPVKRVLNADLESEVEKLEKANRPILHMFESGPGAVVIVYAPPANRAEPGERETR